MDLDEAIAKCRSGGVTSAEFYENGNVKSIALGPEQGGSTTDEGDDEKPKNRPLRDMALRLASGQNLVPKHE